MSDINENQENLEQREVVDEQVKPVGYRSQSEKHSETTRYIPLVISSHNHNLFEMKKRVDKKIEELNAELATKTTERERNVVITSIQAQRTLLEHIEYASQGHHHVNDMYGLFENTSDWTQAVQLGTSISACRPSAPKLTKDNDGFIKGSAQVFAAFSKNTGVGTPSTFQLYDSMISVTVSNISEKALLQIIQLLNELRNEAGFQHKGALYTATDAKINCVIAEFCLQHVTASTLRETTFENLLQVFRITDLQALVTGTLASVYPDGYPFFWSCINEAECDYTSFSQLSTGTLDGVAKLNHGRMTWYNYKKITPAIHRFVNCAMGIHTVEQVLEMQEKIHVPREIGPFNENGALIHMKINKPYYLDYRQETYEWLSEVATTADEIIAKTSNESSVMNARRRRAEFMQAQIIRLSLLRHKPWVTEVSYTNPGEDPVRAQGEDIHAALEALCGHEEVIENAERIFAKAKNRMMVSATGIAMHKCPACGTVQNQNMDASEHEYTSIIPRNVIADFFYITALSHQA